MKYRIHLRIPLGDTQHIDCNWVEPIDNVVWYWKGEGKPADDSKPDGVIPIANVKACVTHPDSEQ